MPPSSLYVHIPFCSSLCAYCDFPKVLYRNDWAESYLSALFREIELRKIGKVKTIYVGGGTPSCLPFSSLEKLLSFLSPHLEQGGEFSFEANPESLTKEKACLLHRLGVNRVSLGVESSLPSFLKKLKRNHTFEDAVEAVQNLREAGITNLNADWMIALPGETLGDLKKEERAFLSLGVDHLSVYTLILEEGTLFSLQKVKPLKEEEEAAQFEEVLSCLREAGYERYEVSNFCRNGKKCLHNLVYWKDEEFYGVGMGASGFVDGRRYANTRSLSSYIKGEGLEIASDVSGEEDFLLTNLRLQEGFSLAHFKNRCGRDFLAAYGDKLAKLEKEGLLKRWRGSIVPTDRGIELLDYVLLTLIA